MELDKEGDLLEMSFDSQEDFAAFALVLSQYAEQHEMTGVAVVFGATATACMNGQIDELAEHCKNFGTKGG